MIERAEMEAVVEAILFVSNDPVSKDRLLEVFSAGERERAAEAVDAVIDRYRGGAHPGLMIDQVAGGLRLVSRPELHGYLRRFFEVSGSNKLSMAALETLAIVAYRQPVTGPEINELRGVSSQGVLKTLLERRLVRVAGRKEVVGKPFLYATTREFLMHFGLRSLKELPPLEQFEELFSGDPEATAEPRPADAEEVADQEAAAIEEQREDAFERQEEAADARQQEAAEELELPVDAPEPTSPSENDEAESEGAVAASDGEPAADPKPRSDVGTTPTETSIGESSSEGE